MLAPVRIDGHELQPRDEIHRRKLEALRVFVERLLASPARDQIAKIILFGSVARGEARAESDVDVMVFGSAPLKRADDAVVDSAWQTTLDLSESVEPLVYSIGTFDDPISDFEWHVIETGEEVYSMDNVTLTRQAAETFYGLAKQYMSEARRKYEPDLEASRRTSIDVAYNAAELAAKGMLRLVVSELPKTHSGINTLFSAEYIRKKRAPSHLGREFTLSLKSRNLARYDGNAEISPEMVKEVFRFADGMIALFEQKLDEEYEQKNHP